jgi:hypothetical protein
MRRSNRRKEKDEFWDSGSVESEPLNTSDDAEEDSKLSTIVTEYSSSFEKVEHTKNELRERLRNEVIGGFVSEVLQKAPPPSVFGAELVGPRRILDEEKYETIML